MKFDNIYVLTTGRSGSVTLSKAFSHCTNYTVGHESRINLEEGRFDYPSGHIEVDNRLSWLLDSIPLFDENLNEKRVFFIWLYRETSKVAQSFAKRFNQPGIFRSYVKGIRCIEKPKNLLRLAEDMVFQIERKIEEFLHSQDSFGESLFNHFEIDIDNPEESFRTIWNEIGAEGDLNAALNELKKKYNASK